MNNASITHASLRLMERLAMIATANTDWAAVTQSSTRWTESSGRPRNSVAKTANTMGRVPTRSVHWFTFEEIRAPMPVRAANRQATKLVKLLIERGADVNAKTTEKYNSGRTALLFAGNVATIRVLLDAGADPKAVDENGQHTWHNQTAAVAKLLKDAAGVK